MSEFQEIKEKIYLEEKVEYILEEIECWGIGTEQKGKLYVAGLPDGDNKRSVQIKNNPNLNAAIRSKGINGDIYDIISFVVFGSDTEEKREKTLYKSKFWICQKLKYYEFIDDFYKETSDEIKPAPQFNKWLSKVKKNRNFNKDEIINNVLPDETLEQFGVIPYKKWFDEGLQCKTQRVFGVGIDVRSERITFPVHNKDGQLISVKARYCGSNQKIEDDYKYLYLYNCNKSIEFFNFHRALPYIMEKKEVIIVEGGKTTMFLYQWNYKNSISVEGDGLSDYQVNILKDLGLGIKHVFAFDKDKDATFVKKEASKLNGRMKYGILDTEDYLMYKDSPTDKGKMVWDKLYTEHSYRI